MKLKRVATATVMAVVVLAAAIGFTHRTHAQTTNQLAGTYRLITTKTTVLATGETTYPLGKSPQGYIMYGRDGRMMVLQLAEKRPQPKDLATTTDQDRIDLFKTMVAYSGTYDFDGKIVTQHIDASWNGIKDSVQRNIKLDGRTLFMSYTGPNVRTGVVGTVELVWEKVD